VAPFAPAPEHASAAPVGDPTARAPSVAAEIDNGEIVVGERVTVHATGDEMGTPSPLPSPLIPHAQVIVVASDQQTLIPELDGVGLCVGQRCGGQRMARDWHGACGEPPMI